jgi:hypothetical protein
MPCPSCGYIASSGYYAPCPNCGRMAPWGKSLQSDSPKALATETRDTQPNPQLPSPGIIAGHKQSMSSNPLPGPSSDHIRRLEGLKPDVGYVGGQRVTVIPQSLYRESTGDHSVRTGHRLSTQLPYYRLSNSPFSYTNTSSNILRPDAKTFIAAAPGATYPPSIANPRIDSRGLDGGKKMDHQNSTSLSSEKPKESAIEAKVLSGAYEVSRGNPQQRSNSHHGDATGGFINPHDSPSHNDSRESHDRPPYVTDYILIHISGTGIENNVMQSDVDPLINRFRSIRRLSPEYPEKHQLSYGTPGSPSSRRINDSAADRHPPIPPIHTPGPGKFLVSRICFHGANNAFVASKVAENPLFDSKKLPDDKTTNSSMKNPSHATHTTTTAHEPQESWEIVDSYSFYNKNNQALLNEESVIAIKPDDTKSLEPLDIRKPQLGHSRRTR